MNISTHIAKHYKEVIFGGNWTYSNLKDNLEGVNWEQAITKFGDFNTIATLVFHINYYVCAAIRVLNNEPINAEDKYSFEHPPIHSSKDWEDMLNKTWSDSKMFIDLIEKLPENKMEDVFYEEKYGIYYRNLHGIVEHSHYHLGQIALIKKFLNQEK